MCLNVILGMSFFLLRINPFISTAPQPPQEVTARLVTPVVIEVRWGRPPTPTFRAQLILYTVYAIPFSSQISPSPRGKRQVDASNPLQTIAKVEY